MSDEAGAAGIGWLQACAFHELPCSGVRTLALPRLNLGKV